MASGALDAYSFPILFHNEVCHCYEMGISTRVKNEDTIAIDIGNFAIGFAVVVTTKDEIEARNLLCHLQRGVLIFCACGVFTSHTAVEESDNYIGLAPHFGHIFTGYFHHVVKAHPRPKVFGKPVGDARGEQT